MVQSASTKDYKIGYCVQISWFCILKDKKFLWTCSFLATNLTNFVSPSLKLHNQYCNSACHWFVKSQLLDFFFSFLFYFSVFCVRKTKTLSMRQRSNGKPSIPSFMSNLCTWHRPLSFPSKVCISLFGTGEKTGLTSMLVSYFHFIQL